MPMPSGIVTPSVLIALVTVSLQEDRPAAGYVRAWSGFWLVGFDDVSPSKSQAQLVGPPVDVSANATVVPARTCVVKLASTKPTLM